MRREAYNPAEEAAVRDNGFSLATGGVFSIDGESFKEKTASITLPGTGTNKILRIQAFYNGVANTIGLQADSSFPSQYHTITSTGAAGETERTVQ